MYGLHLCRSLVYWAGDRRTHGSVRRLGDLRQGISHTRDPYLRLRFGTGMLRQTDRQTERIVKRGFPSKTTHEIRVINLTELEFLGWVWVPTTADLLTCCGWPYLFTYAIFGSNSTTDTQICYGCWYDHSRFACQLWHRTQTQALNSPSNGGVQQPLKFSRLDLAFFFQIILFTVPLTVYLSHCVDLSLRYHGYSKSTSGVVMLLEHLQHHLVFYVFVLLHGFFGFREFYKAYGESTKIFVLK